MREKLKNILSDKIDDDIINHIINNSNILFLNKGENIISYGESKPNIYIIIEGSLLRNITTEAGISKTVMFHTEELLPIVTSIDSYYLKKETKYDIIANERSQVIEIPFNVLNHLIKENHSLSIFSLDYMIKKYYITEVFRNNLISLTSQQFLEFLYSDYPFLLQKFSSFSIANFMGITPEWFSKTKKKIFS